jgi:hypothetical protein
VPDTAKCPICHTVHAKPNPTPGEQLVCAACDEPFTFGTSAAKLIPLAAPESAPKAAPKPAPKSKPGSERPPAAPNGARAKGRPRESNRPRRRPPRGVSPIVWVAVAALAGVGVLFVIGIGVVIFLSAPDQTAQRPEPTRAPAPVFTPPPPQVNEWNPAPIPGPAPVAAPVTPPPAPKRPLAAFAEPVNPYRLDTQTTLRELRSVTLPAAPRKKPGAVGSAGTADYVQVVHSPRHQLLFVRCVVDVLVYDLKEDKVITTQPAKEQFSDMSLAGDQSVLFVADFGGEHTGYGTPIKPSRVHRFDLAARKWDERRAPKIAWRLEAVDPERLLLEAQDQWVDVTLNLWDDGSGAMKEVARTSADRTGDMEYDPRTGRAYHANFGLTVRTVDGDALKQSGGNGNITGKGAWNIALSQDGSRLYYGLVQVSTADLMKELRTFPEAILAASRDVAFGAKGYYRASDGQKLGEYEFKTTGGTAGDGNLVPSAIAVSPDGLSVWVLDRTRNVARQYALEGEK